MRFEKCGNENGQTIMLIHGMATTGHACFDRIIPLLNTYCIILCEVDGHYSNSSYVSLDKCCEEIEKYITDNYDGSIYALLGFSMGGSIGIRLMDRVNVTIQRVILDAAFCVKMGMFTPVFREMFCYGVGRIKSGKQIPKVIYENIMGKGNNSLIEMMYMDISKETIRGVCNDVYQIDITDRIKQFKGKVLFMHGSNEPFPRKSLARLKEYFPNIESKVIDKMGHGQFLHDKSEEYAGIILKYLE